MAGGPACIDVFNGDADGIIALHILRSRESAEAELVTGLKRDIRLLDGVAESREALITALDISLEENLSACEKLLARGCSVRWFDHHRPGKVPLSKAMEAHIDERPDCCTAMLVDRWAGGGHGLWAAAAAFGDNLHEEAEALAGGMNSGEIRRLREIGETVNYNAYGESREDLNAWPADVYLDLHRHSSPFDYDRGSAIFGRIRVRMLCDERELAASEVLFRSEAGTCVLLPDGAASRRMSGIYSNRLVREEPEKAHAILTRLGTGRTFRVSIRAPLCSPCGADKLAARFPSGGGRARAAGINGLPEERLEEFARCFREIFSGQPCS